MNNQFATQFLREELDEFDSLRDMLSQLGASKDSVELLVNAVAKGHIEPSKAVEIVKSTVMNEDGAAAAAPAGGSTTGGGVTNGATFTPGSGEQYAAGTRKKKYQEGAFEDDEIAIYDGEDGLTKIYKREGGTYYGVNNEFDFYAKDKAELLHKLKTWGYKLLTGTLDEDAPRLAGSPAKTNKQGAKNLNAYSSVGFTKAPSATEAGKHMKSIDVVDLWDEDPLYESRAYSKFKKETAVRSKPDQMHEAAKIIQNKLHEIEKLLEFTSQMKNELSEGEQTLEYKHNTKKVFERIHKKVVEVYTKVKGLK